MNFAVQPYQLRRTATHYESMGEAFPAAFGYLSHLQVAGGGQVAADVRSGVDRARVDLEKAYAASGPFPQWFVNAGAALRGIAADYEAIDDDVRKRMDALLPTPENERSRFGLSPDDEEPGVSTADVTGELKAPGTGFAEYDQWRDVVNLVRTISDFMWLVEGAEHLLLKLGWTAAGNVASDNLREILSVRWDDVGRVGVSVGCLMKFTDRLQDETAATTLELSKHWSGNAATAAYLSVGRFDDALAAHETDLTSMAQTIRNFAYGMRYWSDFLVDAIETLGLDWPRILEDAGQALLRGATDVIALIARSLTRWIQAVTLASSGILALCGSFALVFGQTSDYDVSVPRGSVPDFDRADVDGPR